MQRATNPLNMALMMAKEFPEGAGWNSFGHIAKAEDFPKNE
jgi:hypothetical protein